MAFIRKDGSRVVPASQRVVPVTSSPEVAPDISSSPAQLVEASPDARPDKNQPTGDYEVGYCRPPVSGRIKPGEVRNPRGRAGAPALGTMVLKAMRETLLIRTAAGERKVSRVEAIVMKSVEKALKGDNRAIEQSLIRYEQALADVASKVRDAAPQDMSAADRAILDAFLRTAGPSPRAAL
jgi:hypothetical protein